MLGSTETRGLNNSAKEKTEGCWLNRTTVMSGDKPSQDRTARACLSPMEPTKGLGAVNMVIVGPSKSI